MTNHERRNMCKKLNFLAYSESEQSSSKIKSQVKNNT